MDTRAGQINAKHMNIRFTSTILADTPRIIMVGGDDGTPVVDAVTANFKDGYVSTGSGSDMLDVIKGYLAFIGSSAVLTENVKYILNIRIKYRIT